MDRARAIACMLVAATGAPAAASAQTAIEYPAECATARTSFTCFAEVQSGAVVTIRRAPDSWNDALVATADPTDCARQIAAAATAHGLRAVVLGSTVDVCDDVTIIVDEPSIGSCSLSTVPMRCARPTPPGSQPPETVTAPYLTWEVALAQAAIADPAFGESGVAWGAVGRVGVALDPVVALSLSPTVLGGVWRNGGIASVAITADVQLVARHPFGAVDLDFLLGAGMWWPSLSCGVGGATIAACHYTVAGRLGFRMLPIPIDASHPRNGAFSVGADILVGYSPERTEVVIAPVTTFGLAFF